MDLRTKIEEQFKSAIKSKNTEKTNTLRLIRNAINNKDIENRSSTSEKPVDDQQILNILQILIKQRRESIESFKAASRNDLIEKENKEIEIINNFLPEQISDEELKIIIQNFITENNISSIKEMGKIMAYLKSSYTGSVDLSLAGKIIKDLLGK